MLAKEFQIPRKKSPYHVTNNFARMWELVALLVEPVKSVETASTSVFFLFRKLYRFVST